MTIRTFLITGLQDGRAMLVRHRLLALTLVVLFAIAGSSRFLRGDILGTGGVGGGGGGASTAAESLRSCNSKGTMFEHTQNLQEVRQMYRAAMSGVVGERETIIKTPSEWKCGTGADGEPAIPKLQSLASRLPGWQYYVTAPLFFGSVTVPISRPVTFASFGSIVAELQREYECKLTELQDRNIANVSLNNDKEIPAQYCCINVGDAMMGSELGCAAVSDPSICVTPVTTQPACDQTCPVLLYMTDLAERMPSLHGSLAQERQVSRVVVERTLSTMRSFEMNYAVARQLICYQRASLDLKNEMSLLADAVSCMPKIWNAVTSIHDKK